MRIRTMIALVSALALLQGGYASASGQVNAQTFQTSVNLQVVPFAQIQILGSPLLYLEIAPNDASTLPSHGVTFRVSGNANATVTAAPDSFELVSTGEHMGKAVLGVQSVGYRLRLDFPSVGVVGSPKRSANLPGYQDGPTDPPLSVNLMATGGTRDGQLHMEASPDWTPNGGLPLPGLYAGSVVLTVTAN